jgi:hypothetical protein
MRWFIFFCGLRLLASVPVPQPSQVWRPPEAASQCREIHVEALLIDVSRSMGRAGRFQDARLSAVERIKAAPACTLEVVGSFGMTADIVRGEFATDEDSRQRLITSVNGLRPTHMYTNLDEAAKLIELLSYQVRIVYGSRAAPLLVNAYTDGQSEPSQGKASFSLAEYLAARMGARYMRVTPSQLGSLQEFGIQAYTDDQRKGTQKGEITPSRLKFSLLFAGLGLVGLILAFLGVLVWRSSGRENQVRAPLVALSASESAPNDEGQQPLLIASERRIEVAAGVPAVFSTDANSATYVAKVVPGAANGELFRIEPLPNGSVRIQSSHSRFTVNDEPLDADRRLEVDIHEPIRIRLGPREFNIIGVFGRPQRLERADDIFDAEALHH